MLQKSSISRKKWSEHWWVWLIPLIIFLGTFYVYPMFKVFHMSFTDMRIDRTTYKYTFGSYRRILTDKAFRQTLRATFIFAGGSVVFQLGIGLACALLIKQDLFGASLVKISMIIAWIVPGVITGVIWQMLYSTSSWGVFNNILKGWGLPPKSFLSTPNAALISCLVANIWRGTGSSGIMQYAALKGIPLEYYEAARIDGANAFQIFTKITLPQLRPMIMINLVLISIYSMNTYDSIYALTGGGPGDATLVLPLAAYKSVFTYLSMGQGSVYAVLLMIFSIILTLIYMQLLGSKEE